jgi:ferredoxin-NADP reductase
MVTTHLWKTAAIVQETKDTVTVIFDTGGIPFKYEPGQFINLTLLINGQPVTRSYSLSSNPDEDINPSITVKRVNGGVMSNFIIDNIAGISKWRIEGPYGNFTPLPGTYTSSHVILLAGGSGITPLFSIARSILSKSPDTTVTLIYSSRTPDDIIFKGSIEDWKQRFPGRLKSYHVLSQPTDGMQSSDGTVIKGRLNKLIARKLIKQAVGDPLNGVQYFICGPTGLMKTHREMLETMQVPAENIYMEWFAPEPSNQQVILPQEPQEVMLHFYEQSNLLDVEAGQSILTAALEDKIPLPYSCKTGTCGKCTARLTGGKVKMISNYALRQSDIDAGLVLLCQSYPLTDDVTVEIN